MKQPPQNMRRLFVRRRDIKWKWLKTARSEEGSLRDEIPQAGLGGSPTSPSCAKRTYPGIGEGPEPAAPSGRNRQAERGKSQGAKEDRDYASFPGDTNL